MTSVIRDGSGNSFYIGDYIDKGSFSKVYTLECCLSKKRFAGKFVSKEKLQRYGLIDKIWNEIDIHRRLRHENIVQFVSYVEQENHLVIVLEYCSRYSMVHILHVMKTLQVSEAKYFMMQIVSAVEYLHTHRVVHRDLKLGNLFVNTRLEIKLGDFGLAVTIEFLGQKRFSRCGTPNYIAPEVVNGVGHSYEVDIWALGCILYTMLEGTPPFQGENTTSTYNNIIKGQYQFSPHIDESAKMFIIRTLQVDPTYRPPIFELAHFDFLTSRQIHPKPPQFIFGEDGALSLFKTKRSITDRKVIDVLPSKEREFAEFPYNYFLKISNCLSNVNKWTESNFGEFLSEACSIKAPVWVNSWIDYTNSYGFAYQLSSNSFGILFNDYTRMVFQCEERLIYYSKANDTVITFRSSSVPAALVKKVKILLYCGTIMNETLLQAHEARLSAAPTTRTVQPVEVFKWRRGNGEMAMCLTNGCVQVNFARDHTKLIMCGLTKTVTVIESATSMKTLKLDVLNKCGCSKDLRRKLVVVLKYMNSFLSE